MVAKTFGKTHLFIVAIVVGYTLLYWRNSLIFGLAPIDGDMLFLSYPTWAIGKKLLLSFHFLWEPYRNMGQPFLAAPQNEALYPIRFLSAFTDFVDYDRIFLVFHSLLSGGFGYLLIKKLYEDEMAGVLAALQFGFGALIFWKGLYQWDLATLAWVPAIFYFFVSGRPMALGICLALQWFAGYPPVVILTVGCLLVLWLLRDNRSEDFACLVKGGILGAGLAAVQWIPFLEYLRLCDRPLFLETAVATQASINPRVLPGEFLAPAFALPHLKHASIGIAGFYFGPLLTASFLMGIWKGKKFERLAALVVFAACVLSTGSHLPFYSLIPGIRIFRYPAMWMIPVSAFMILVSARGVASIKRRGIKIALVGLMALDLLVLTYSFEYAWGSRRFLTEPPNDSTEWQSLDLSHRIFHSAPIMYKRYLWKVNPGTVSQWDFLKGILAPSLGTVWGVREATSQCTLNSVRSLAFIKRLNEESSPALFSLADVGTAVDLRSPGKADPSRDDIAVFKIPHPGGRVFFADGRPISVQRDEPGDIQLAAEGPGRVVFSEVYFPGWRVFVDGERQTVEMIEDTFMAVGISPGKHQIRFSYSPLSFWVGLGVTVFTGAFLFFKIRQSRQSS